MIRVAVRLSLKETSEVTETGVCVATRDYQLWPSKTVRRYSSHIWVSVYIFTHASGHTHTLVSQKEKKARHPLVTQSLPLSILLPLTHTYAHLSATCLPPSLAHPTPTHIMYTKLNSTARAQPKWQLFWTWELNPCVPDSGFQIYDRSHLSHRWCSETHFTS